MFNNYPDIKKLTPNKNNIINIQFIHKFFPKWIFTSNNKSNEWIFYEYIFSNTILLNDLFIKEAFIKETKKIYMIFPSNYLEFDIYETSNNLDLENFLSNELKNNMGVDIYLTPFNYEWAIRISREYSISDNLQREIILQTNTILPSHSSTIKIIQQG